MTKLQAVLFDMDGTLVETESLWNEAEILTMAKFGQLWTPEEQEFALGGPFSIVVEYMAKKANSTLQDVGDALQATIVDLMRTRPLPTQPGIRELHDAVEAAGLPTGLVTNSFRVLVDIVLESTGLEFDVIVCGDEVAENKPHPMPYLTACEALGVDPAGVVVLEDSSTGIASASAAGCSVVAIPQLSVIEEADQQLIVPSAESITVASLERMIAARA